jgi:predicted nucleic acid-binding protein
MWVLDASVAVRWFLEEETHELADAVLERVVENPRKFAVPELFGFEVFAVLERLHPKGLDTFVRGILPLLEGGVLRHPMTKDLAEKADRFVQKGLTGYDASYAALALDLGGCWITFDEKAHRRIEADGVSVSLAAGLPPNWHEDWGT